MGVKKATPSAGPGKDPEAFTVEYRDTVATRFLQPLADLWALMNQRKRGRSAEGLPAAFVLLAYTCLESWAVRNRCDRLEKFPNHIWAQAPKKDGWTLVSALKRSRAGKRLIQRAEELLIVRNAIAHGHMYKTFQEWTGDSRVRYRRGEQLHGRKLGNLESLIDLKTRQTKQLGIHYVPTEIQSEDCQAVATLMIQVFQHFAKSGSLHPDFKGWTVVFPHLSNRRAGSFQVTPYALFSLISEGLDSPGSKGYVYPLE